MEMTNLDWCDIKYFKPTEFSYPNKMNPYLIRRLDKFREMIGKPIYVHSDYRPGDSGCHGKGDAVDIHAKDINIIDLYLLAEKSGLFSGIGIYPSWNNPGLHLDVRSGEPARWGAWQKAKPYNYVPINANFIDELCYTFL